ncbi:hypothetical protein [Lactobacillus gallinarum]|uniref:hypothetical protein n=1 Tax=Lactobacillus gallinarum TaxID=52242 RepID=UPI0024B12533|nr:hypothetical protein [Lactobacillus gallinarum]
MSIYEMFVQMWELDFQMGLFGKDYFKGLVQNGQLQVADYKKVTGEDYDATSDQTANTPQA